jgi:hypothetical protein
MKLTDILLGAVAVYIGIGVFKCFFQAPTGSQLVCPVVTGPGGVPVPAAACSGTPTPCNNQNFQCVLGWPMATTSSCSYGVSL